MDVNEMEAGRELDALIAERVMGWEISWLGDKPHRHWRPDDGRTGKWNDLLPAFSTDITAAWVVMHKVCSGPFSVRRTFKKEVKQAITARFGITYLIDDDEVLLRVTPIDICRAAIRATNADNYASPSSLSSSTGETNQ